MLRNKSSLRYGSRVVIFAAMIVGLVLVIGPIDAMGGHDRRDGYDELFAEQIVVDEPPVASLITVETPNEQGYAKVTGSPGSVVPHAIVAFSCLDIASFEYVLAEPDGSFQAEVLAPPGTALMVKHFYDHPGIREFLDEVLPEADGDLEIDPLTATSGTIIQVPLTVHDERGKVFGMAGRLPGENVTGIWSLEGMMMSHPIEGGGQVQYMEGVIRILSPSITTAMDFSDVHGGVSINLIRMFSEDGQYMPTKQIMASSFMTPTGLPIARDSFAISPVGGGAGFEDFSISVNGVAEAGFAWEFPLPEDLTAGYYAPVIEVGFGGGDFDPELPPMEPFGFWMRPGFVFGYGGGYLPLLRIGNPNPPRLTWTLLTDTLSGGTRGTTAREDDGAFGVIPFTTFQSETFIVPREDPRTGEPISYRLEPYMPFISLDDRGVPNAPVIDFKLPSGELSITVQAPDGESIRIGPAPFGQSANRSPSLSNGHLLDNNGGGAMHDVYQAITLDDAFDYTFEQYGHYVITLEGVIEDVWNNEYFGGGTYDVYVARPLKLYTGMLPGTPFEVGDAFAPTVQLYPRFPADISLTLTHLPNSDPSQAIIHTLEGTANQYGYFHPTSNPQSPISFEQPGEYRLDLTASYIDNQGVLWMGSMTWGSVVETPNAQIVAHGRRGLDAYEVDQLWFFHEQTGFHGIGHSFYPYATGDIYWGAQEGAYPDIGSDNIKPVITIQDAVGTITELIKARWERDHSPLEDDYSNAQEFIVEGEIPLFSTTSSQVDLTWAPDDVDQFGYSYRSSERPGARVHETVADGQIPIDYWRYGANYGGQVGVEGDLPNDFKWQFGGAVFRDLSKNINQYAIYGSLWVLIPDDDPMGPRVMPPFRGAAGGPDGGPILTLKGEEIDIFFLPKSGLPGQILQVGDTLAFSGHVGPPLDSLLSVTITSPSGATRTITGQANKIGYFYQPEDDFVVDEPGLWAVDVQVTHEGMTSAGVVVPPYPSGDVLGSEDGRYYFYVLPGDTLALELESPSSGFLPVDGKHIPVVEVVTRIPGGLDSPRAHYTIAMPGYILEQGYVEIHDDIISILYDPMRLSEDFPNIDLTAFDAFRPGLADQVWISVLVTDGDGNAYIGAVTLSGEEVFSR